MKKVPKFAYKPNVPDIFSCQTEQKITNVRPANKSERKAVERIT